MKVNIIFDTQSIGIQVFWSLFKAMGNSSEIELGNTGFFTTNKGIYNRFCDTNPGFEKDAAPVLTEWDIIEEAKLLDKPDLNYIADWEDRIGDASLWNAIITDRRFNFPITAQYVQDYRPAYSHDFLLKVLQVSLKRIDQHFDEVEPHAVVGLNAVTLYDYLYYLIAKSRGIPYFQLKLTRIRNYTSLFTNPLGISPHIGDKIDCYLRDPQVLRAKTELLREATEFVVESQKGSLSYEGAISKKTGSAQVPAEPKIGAVTEFRKGLFSRLMKLLFGKHEDPHYPSARQALWYTKVIKPIRRVYMEKKFFGQSHGVWKDNLNGRPYALYPLNTEPEVALLVYGRSYRNQIETIRNIASSLPVGWLLVVKEHPNAKGYRSSGFYTKLREIPNVMLVGPAVSSNDLVVHSEMVFVVFGTIGFEAALKKKPVIALCETPYGSFPEHMVRYVDSILNLGDEIRDLLQSYRYDEWAIISYVAAHIESSIKLNLFTGLLGKGGRESTEMSQSIDEQYELLACYAIQRIKEEAKISMTERNEYIDGAA